MDNYVYSTSKLYRFNLSKNFIERRNTFNNEYVEHQSMSLHSDALDIIFGETEHSPEQNDLLEQLRKHVADKDYVYSDGKYYRYNVVTKTLEIAVPTLGDFWRKADGEFLLVADVCAGNFGEYSTESQSMLNKLRKL